MADVYTVTTEPNTYPVTLNEVKGYLKISHSSEDTLLNTLIPSATNVLESYTGRWFISRDAVGEFDSIRVTGQEIYPFIEIRRSPLLSVASVQNFLGGQYIDMTVNTDYEVKSYYSYGRIVFFNSINVDDKKVYPLRTSFNAGFGNADAVPEVIKIAIMQMVNYMWRNRGDCDPVCGVRFQGIIIPTSIVALISKYTIRNTWG